MHDLADFRRLAKWSVYGILFTCALLAILVCVLLCCGRVSYEYQYRTGPEQFRVLLVYRINGHWVRLDRTAWDRELVAFNRRHANERKDDTATWHNVGVEQLVSVLHFDSIFWEDADALRRDNERLFQWAERFSESEELK